MNVAGAAGSDTGGLFAAIDAQDAASFVSYLTEDAVFRFGSAPPVQGREQIRAAVDAFFATIAGCRHTISNSLRSGPTLVCEAATGYLTDDSIVTEARPASPEPLIEEEEGENEPPIVSKEELNLTCYNLMIDVLSCQMELQDIEKKYPGFIHSKLQQVKKGKLTVRINIDKERFSDCKSKPGRGGCSLVLVLLPTAVESGARNFSFKA